MIEEGREWELHEKSRTHKKLLNRANRIKAGGHQYPKQQEKQKAEDHAFDAPTPWHKCIWIHYFHIDFSRSAYDLI